MAKSNSGEFWATIDLLLTIESHRSEKDLRDEADDWADKFIARKSAAKNSDETFTPHLYSGLSVDTSSKIDDDIVKFIAGLNLPPIECKFCHPQIRTKLEKLMGSNLVSLTDREYMMYLQQRILLDYAVCMNKRIALRQAEEMERVKGLVLTGKIPLRQAPPEMAKHPVMLIDEYCRNVLAERRAKIKILKANIPKHLYWDDTPDPPSGLSIESGHVLRKSNDMLCVPPELLLASDDDENLADGYMVNEEIYDSMHFESDMIKEFRNCETVEEMYMLADRIIGFFEEIESESELLGDGIAAD